MNKLLIDKEYMLLKDEEVSIEISKKNVTLEIEGRVKINDFNSKEDLNLNIIVKDNANLIYNKYSNNISSINVKIDVNENSNVSYNQSLYNTIEGDYEVFTNILGSNNNVDVNYYGVTNQNGKIKVNATGDVKKGITNNEMLENVRILALNDEENIIYPNLLVSTDEAIINHNATISGLNKDYLFYLESKGLSKEESAKLIVKGFILSKLNISEEDKENIKF